MGEKWPKRTKLTSVVSMPMVMDGGSLFHSDEVFGTKVAVHAFVRRDGNASFVNICLFIFIP